MKKIKTTNLLYLLLLFIFASCLPQEKSTQCGENEAFDSTKRKCVASLGVTGNTLNIASISPATSYTVSSTDAAKTHNITVSDPYSNGYQIKWYLTYPNNTTLLLSTALSVTFSHTSFAAGAYIMEVQLLDSSGTTIVDNRSWSINIITDQTPDVLPVTATPLTTTTTSANIAISATANNPDGITNVNYQWFVNGAAVAGQSGTFSSTTQALSLSFDSTTTSAYFVGAGIYNVQLQLTENGSGSNYDTYTWSIQNNIPNFANISLGTSAFATTTPTTASIITVIDETTISSNGFLYDVDGDTNLDSIDFCVQADNINGVDGDGVFVDFLVDGVNIPGATNQQLILSNSSYCLQSFNNYSYNIPDVISQESHTITAVVYDKYTGSSSNPTYNGYNQVDTFSWTIRVRQKNTPPSLIIDSAATNITCGSTTSTSETGCTITQDTSFDVALTVTDDDYDPTDFASEYAKFRVEFYLDGSLLDGTHSISSSDCYEDFSETAGTSRYICSLTINSYDTNGPIDASAANYTITAKVIDADSPYITPDTKESNTVSWQVSTVNAINSGITLNQFASDDADRIANPTYSYLSTQAIPGTALDLDAALGAATEGDNITFHVTADDPERDSHSIKIEKCSDVTCGVGAITTLTTLTVNSTDDTNPRTTSVNHQIGEDEVIGTDRANVFYRITVEDTPGAVISQQIITVSINNYNPDPVFNSANFNPALATPLIAITGFPLSIDPGTITDASSVADSDGDVIKYQWMIDTNNDGVYSAIDGATSKVLVWTPGSELDFATQTGSAIELKLCLGDDGVDNAGAAKDAMNAGATDCKSPALDTTDWNVTVFSNMVLGSSYGEDISGHTSQGEIAVWIDPTSTNPLVKYKAYVSNGSDIIVEKHVISSTGVKAGSTEQTVEELKSIEFKAVSDGSTPAGISSLSLTGDTTNDALYIAYMAPVSSVDVVHIRKIDISTGKTGFTHSGKFGFDPGYDNLENNTTLAGDVTELTNGSGELEITFSGTTAGTTVTFSGLHTGVASSFLIGTDFCSVLCADASAAAADFASAINASTETQVQGITASVVGAVVTLEGVIEGNFIEHDYDATAIGQIMVNQTTNQWILPIIDHSYSESTGNKHKVALASGALNARLSSVAPSKTPLDSLNTIPSQEITNDITSADRMIIAVKGSATGEIAVYEVDTSLSIVDTNTDLFTDTNVSDIRLKVGHTAANTSAYITGKNADNRLAFARVDSAAGDFNFGTITTNLDLDAGFPLISGFSNYDITGGRLANQLLVGIVDGTNNDAYLLEVEGSTPTINCNYDGSANTSYDKCMKVQATTSSVVFDLPIALSDVVEDVTIGTAGSVTDENQRDIIFYGLHIDDGGGDILTDAQPIGGIINVEGISLTADDSTPANIGTTYALPFVAP